MQTCPGGNISLIHLHDKESHSMRTLPSTWQRSRRKRTVKRKMSFSLTVRPNGGFHHALDSLGLRRRWASLAARGSLGKATLGGCSHGHIAYPTAWSSFTRPSTHSRSNHHTRTAGPALMGFARLFSLAGPRTVRNRRCGWENMHEGSHALLLYNS
jgi:hypothetical protein